MDPALEVPVAGQHRGHDEFVVLDRLRDRLVERSRVADAGRAAVAGQRESKLLERRHQAGRFEVAGHGLGARGQRRLDRGRHGQPAGDRVPGEQRGADHHDRVGGVRARRDRRDRDRAGLDRRAPVADLDRDRLVVVVVIAHRGVGRRVGDRLVAPRVRRRERRWVAGRERSRRGRLDLPASGATAFDLPFAERDQPVRKVRPEVRPERSQRNPVLRPARPGDGRVHRREVELEGLVEVRTRAGLAPQPLLFRVPLDEPDPVRRPAGQPQVRQRLVVDREERRGRPELRAHVADRGPIGEGEPGEPVAGELHERRAIAASR